MKKPMRCSALSYGLKTKCTYLIREPGIIDMYSKSEDLFQQPVDFSISISRKYIEFEIFTERK